MIYKLRVLGQNSNINNLNTNLTSQNTYPNLNVLTYVSKFSKFSIFHTKQYG